MDNPFEDEQIEEIKEIMASDGPAAAAAKIQERLNEWKNIPLNIAITGESGSGKSSFVNAFRGVDDGDEEMAAPTGVVECTKVPTQYPSPKCPNVVLWDLPGMGTTKFPAAEYLQHVGFERFDFFIIISDIRFTENDAKLALEIKRIEKKFYFVRSKLDNNLRDDERKQKKKFSAERTLKEIRDDCNRRLVEQGVESPQVFLVSSIYLHLHDFPLLEETLERELPAHQREALLLAMPNISLNIINKKKMALQALIGLTASASALTAAAPIPGLSVAADLVMLVTSITGFKNSFGLDPQSLQNLAHSVDVPVEDLRGVMRSPLSLNTISSDLILKVLCCSLVDLSLLLAEEGLRFIPFIGIPIAMSLSAAFTSKVLSTALDMLAEDAQKVFRKALGLSTSV